LVGNPERRSKRWWGDSLKMDFQEIGSW
jgi:hypothetical protein